MLKAGFLTTSAHRGAERSSDAWSAGDGIGETLRVAALDRAVPSRTTARQLRNIDREIPTSAATCIKGRPPLSNSATASRLNSGENSLLVFAIRTPPMPPHDSAGRTMTAPTTISISQKTTLAEWGHPHMTRPAGRVVVSSTSWDHACRVRSALLRHDDSWQRHLEPK